MSVGSVFRRVKNAAGNALGLYELPEGNRRFLFTHFNFLLFTTIPGVFINTFFYRQDGRISTIAIYTAICCFGSALFMHVSSTISLKKSPVFVMRAGVILFNLFYMTLLVLQSHAVQFMPLLGFLNAVASSFYWQGYNSLLQDNTDSTNLNKTISLLGICNAVVSLFIPGLSGFVITRFKGSAGYMVVFMASFAVSLFTTYLTTRIPYTHHHQKSNLLKTYIRVFKTKSWLLMLLCETLRGIRDLSFPMFISIVLFKMIENETFLGFNTMACGLATVIAYYYVGKYIRERRWVGSVVFCSVTLVLLFLVLFCKMNPAVVFVAAILNAMLTVGIANPTIAALFSMFDRLEGDTNFAQLMAIHEMFLAVGRVIGLVIVIMLAVSDRLYPVAMLVLNASAILSAGLLKLAMNAYHQKNQAPDEV